MDLKVQSTIQIQNERSLQIQFALFEISWVLNLNMKQISLGSVHGGFFIQHQKATA